MDPSSRMGNHSQCGLSQHQIPDPSTTTIVSIKCGLWEDGECREVGIVLGEREEIIPEIALKKCG